MEQQNEHSLFGLSIDQQSKSFLSETAKWTKFLSIVGFVVCGLIVIAGIFLTTQLSNLDNAFNEINDTRPYRQPSFGNFGPAMAVVYILMAALYFIPCLFLYRFSTNMKSALLANDQALLNIAFQNLKRTFKFVGLLTLIALVIYGVILLFALLFAGFSG